MKTQAQIKRVLSITVLTLLSSLSQSWAAGGVGTGGGNPIPVQPNVKPYLPEIEKIISEIRPMARAELNHLRNWGACSTSSGANCNLEPFMIARSKLLNNPDKTRKIIDTFKLSILQDRACVVVEDGIVQHKAASATLPNNICFSLSEIGKYDIPPDDFNFSRKMIKGLFFHELTHLLGGDETEAKAIQRHLTSHSTGDYDSVYAISNIQGTAGIVKSAIEHLDLMLESVRSNKITDLAICSKLPLFLSEITRGKRVTLTEEEDWIFDRAVSRIALAAKGFCEPDDFYKSVFKNRSEISEHELQVFLAERNYPKDSEMKNIELDRAHRLSSKTTFFNNLIDHSKDILIKELSIARIDIVRTSQALKEMAKF